MNVFGILGLIGFIGVVVTIVLRGNSQHMVDIARDRETRQEWKAEKADVSRLGCTIVLVACVLAVLFLYIGGR